MKKALRGIFSILMVMILMSSCVRDMIGYDVNGKTTELNLERIDFTTAISELESSGCFIVSYPDGLEETPQNAIITAVDFPLNTSGVAKPGNQIAVQISLMNEEGSVVSQKCSKIKIDALAAPVINAITAKDTSANISFAPSYSMPCEITSEYYYTVDVTEKASGREIEPEEITFGSYNSDTTHPD